MIPEMRGNITEVILRVRNWIVPEGSHESKTFIDRR
jgi:hypothetical protein